jgi:hypothetical protein
LYSKQAEIICGPNTNGFMDIKGNMTVEIINLSIQTMLSKLSKPLLTVNHVFLSLIMCYVNTAKTPLPECCVTYGKWHDGFFDSGQIETSDIITTKGNAQLYIAECAFGYSSKSYVRLEDETSTILLQNCFSESGRGCKAQRFDRFSSFCPTIIEDVFPQFLFLRVFNHSISTKIHFVIILGILCNGAPKEMTLIYWKIQKLLLTAGEILLVIVDPVISTIL